MALDIAVLIGEWGALHGKSPELIPVADFLMSEFDRHGFSDTFWAYGKFLDEASFLGVLQKPYPVSSSGKLKAYNYDMESGVFDCQWTESAEISAPTIIFIPNIEILNRELIGITPGAESIELLKNENAPSGYLIIPASGESVDRMVQIDMASTVQKNQP